MVISRINYIRVHCSWTELVLFRTQSLVFINILAHFLRQYWFCFRGLFAKEELLLLYQQHCCFRAAGQDILSSNVNTLYILHRLWLASMSKVWNNSCGSTATFSSPTDAVLWSIYSSWSSFLNEDWNASCHSSGLPYVEYRMDLRGYS